VPLPTQLSYPYSTQLDYYLDEVKNQLLNNDPDVEGDPAEALGDSQQERASELYRGGLRIETAYDPFAQLLAQNAVNEILPESPFTAALVVIDNADGGVRAIANGRTFAEMQFNPATEGGRQAGSAFKTFTLAAALSHGYSPNDSVGAFPVPEYYDDGRPLAEDCHGGSPSLYSAIAKSDNCAFVRLEMSLGPENHGRGGVQVLIDTAKAMGIDSAADFDPTALSTTLGTQSVLPIEMAQAYSVLPNDGVLKRARFITRIVGPNGKVLYQNTDTGTRVLEPNVARSEADMLKGVLRSGTASGTLGGFPREAAGKTGTTDDHADAWFVGFTPQFTAAVWMGHPDGRIPMDGLPVGAVFGATYPAEIWGKFMQDISVGLPELDFWPPDEDMWPSPSYISEEGRRFNQYRPPSYEPYVPPPTPETTVPLVQEPTPTTVKSTPTTVKSTPTTVKPTTPTTAGPGP
jgi:membrane peptidoglycan carboxypeptidase